MPGGALLDGLRESEAGWLSPAGPPEALGDVSLVSPGDEIAVDAADGHLKCAVLRSRLVPHSRAHAPQGPRYAAGGRAAGGDACRRCGADEQAGRRAAHAESVRAQQVVSRLPRSLLRRYAAETGDVVLGRVVEARGGALSYGGASSDDSRVQVAGKRWKLDIDSRQDAALMLSAVALPGNVQVRAGCGAC